jgi:uncharacterized membrane protein
VAKEFINPNWHVILIHYPLGVFVLGLLIELFSFVYRRTSLRLAGRWMIFIGALSCIPTALSGIYALGNVVRMDLPATQVNADRPWAEITAASQLNEEQWEFLGRHTWAQASATALAVVLVTIAVGCSDRWRRRLYVPLLLGLLFSLAAMLWGAYYGGEMVYRHGTAVSAVEEKGAMPHATEPKPTESAADDQVEAKRKLEYFVPPLQLHVLLAGLAVAVAFAALGLSMRAVATADDAGYDADRDLDADLGRSERDMLYEPPVPRGPAAMDVARSLNPEADVGTRRARLPVSRTWLLAALFAAGASASGIWFLAGPDETRTWEPKRLWSLITPNDQNPGLRRIAHVAAGGVIIVTPLLLALVTRVSRRPKVSLTLLALLLVSAVAVQVWLGTLLMLDTPRGSVLRFNASGEAPEPATAPFTAPSASPATEPATAPATAPATDGVATGT